MTDSDDADLPTFRNPPVGEVAIIVQFDRLDVGNTHLVRLWAETEFRTLYPKVTEYAELPPFREVFGVPHRTDGYELRMRQGPPAARYNFRNESLREQIQFQRDRIAFYWHSGEPPGEYPRFPHMLDKFWRDLDVFKQFLAKHEVGEIVPNQCALSYTNVVPKGAGWERPEDLLEVVTFWSPATSGPLLPTLLREYVGAYQSFVISQLGDKREPLARMHVTLSSTTTEPNDSEALELELSVRGAPPTQGRDGLNDFFRSARRHIVKTFLAVTTQRMHKRWGLE